MKAHIVFIAKKIERKTIKDRKVAFITGYQSRTDHNDVKQYDTILAYFYYSDNTKAKVISIANELKRKNFAQCEIFSGSIKTEVEIIDKKRKERNLINTYCVQLVGEKKDGKE